MKILVLTHTLYPESIGGRQKYCYYLSKELAHNGNFVGIVFWRVQGNYDFDSVRPDSLFRIYPIDHKLHRFIPVGAIIYLLKSLFACIFESYDIVLSNSIYFPLLTAFFLRLILRKPYIHVVHDIIEPKKVRAKTPLSIFLRIAYNKANGIIAVSDEIKELVSQTTSSSVMVYYIPPGVDDKFFNIPIKVTSDQDDVCKIFTSRRLEVSKGVDVLIKAVSFLVNKEKLRLYTYVVGDGSEAKKLHQLAKELGVENYIHFTGFIDENLMINLLQVSDVCVVPSRYEGTPIALLEYMAAAKPVIATRIGGITSILRNEDVLVEADNPDMLAIKLKSLIENKELRIKLGILNRHTARMNYSWSVISKKIKKVIQRHIFP